MEDKLKELYKLLNEHKYVFLDEEFISIDNIEDEIEYKREDIENGDSLTLSIYSTKEENKPNLSFEDLGDILDEFDYSTDNAWNIDLINENEETLKKINELFHTLVAPIYIEGKEIARIVIYADENKEIEILKESN